jgi:hypothetical protein
MTPRERLKAAMACEPQDRIPFVIWSNKWPGGELGEQLLEAGACVVNKSSVWRETWRAVTEESFPEKTAQGEEAWRTVYHTPAGDISTLRLPPDKDSWRIKHLFSGPEDYDALEALLADRDYIPHFESFVESDAAFGKDHTLARPTTVYSPFHEILYTLMGIETFCLEWIDNQERVLRLMDILAESYFRRIEMTAESPAFYCVVDGNVDPHVIGTERFQQYSMPYIENACRILHSKGKLAAAHLDADNRLLAPLVAKTPLDIIESLTPPPDCDLSVAEARRFWPDKGLVVNFPSSLHRYGPEKVIDEAQKLLSEAGSKQGFALGILENVSEDSRATMLPLARAVRRS